MPRDVDSCELCSGLGVFSEAVTFERDDSPDQDLTLLGGAALAGLDVVRVRPGGVCHMSPQCALWLSFISRATSARTDDDPCGDESSEKVLEANVCAVVLGWLLVLATTRDVYVIPLLYSHPCFEAQLHMINAVRDVTYLGGFGAPSLKPVELYSMREPRFAEIGNTLLTASGCLPLPWFPSPSQAAFGKPTPSPIADVPTGACRRVSSRCDGPATPTDGL